jgi:small-conductance mechanosensitive channel
VEQFLQIRWWVPGDWIQLVESAGPPIARAIILAIVTLTLARLARSSFEHATRRTGADVNLRLLIGRFVYIGVLALGILTVLDTFGIPITTVIALVGVVGIGIGLALQDILKNFFAGTYLLFERPFRIGDEISVKDFRGIVETIGIRTTTLRTVDNVQIMIPNAVVFAEAVSNRTYERKKDEVTENGETDAPQRPLPPAPSPPAPSPSGRGPG